MPHTDKSKAVKDLVSLETNGEAWNTWAAPEFNSDSSHVIYNLQKAKRKKDDKNKLQNVTEAEESSSESSDNSTEANEEANNTSDDNDEEIEESVEDVEDLEVKIPSAQELEELRRSVELDAYQKGFEKGEAHGLESGKKQVDEHYQPELEQSSKSLQTLIENLTQALNQQEESILQTLLNTVVTMVTNITRKELSIADDALISVIEESLQIIGDSKQTKTILVNPDDLKFLTEKSEHKSWKLVADEKITAGGCQIITEDSSVDSTVETRINDTIEKFLNKEFASH